MFCVLPSKVRQVSRGVVFEHRDFVNRVGFADFSAEHVIGVLGNRANLVGVAGFIPRHALVRLNRPMNVAAIVEE